MPAKRLFAARIPALNPGDFVGWKEKEKEWVGFGGLVAGQPDQTRL